MAFATCVLMCTANEKEKRRGEKKKKKLAKTIKCNLFVIRTSEIEHACSSVLNINTTEDGVLASIIIVNAVAVTVVAESETMIGGVEL